MTLSNLIEKFKWMRIYALENLAFCSFTPKHFLVNLVKILNLHVYLQKLLIFLYPWRCIRKLNLDNQLFSN